MATDSADPGADTGAHTSTDAGAQAGAEPQPKPDAQPGVKPKAKGKRPGSHPAGKRSATNAARRRARELALQGLYQWLLSGEAAGVIDAHMREQEDFAAADSAHFDALLHGCIAEAAALDAALARHTDRRTSLLSPVEHAALLIGAYELMHCLDVPYRVVINEAVELAKSFGGTDGHKFVNGVMDKVASDTRPEEAAAWRASR